MKAALTRFIACTSGATAVEYVVIATGVAAAIFASVRLLGSNLQKTLSPIGNAY